MSARPHRYDQCALWHHLTGDDVVNLGKYVLKTEHQFNLDAGMTNLDDRLPEFFRNSSSTA